MPRYVLEFNMETEESDFRVAVDGYKWKGIVADLDNLLRSAAKYEDSESAAEWREKLWNLLNEAGLDPHVG